MEAFAGCCTIELVEEATGVNFPMLVLYPSFEPERVERIGPYKLNVAVNGALRDGQFPLVLISHGGGGSHLVYRTLARYLARNGFIVGMPEHPFNNRNDNSRFGTVENLAKRPTHIRSAIDWFFTSEKFAPHLRNEDVFVIGHSMGGYTALAAAGGLPTSMAKESLDGLEQIVVISPDSRIKALVLLAPAAVWFRAPGALSGVDLPILMLIGEKDEIAPFSFHGQLILNGLPDRSKIEHRIIENAGHFCFLSPFPSLLTKPDFPPSQDPPGFDRIKFLDELDEEILVFLRRQFQ